MNSSLNHIQQQLKKRKEENAFRELKTNNDLIDFCSNDYLGFASEKSIHLLDKELSQFGSGGSRLITGNYKITEEVEQYIAEYHQAESGLIFNSGYNANVGLFSSLPQKGDTVIYDELIHASIRDGIRLSNANSFSFKHSNTEELTKKIKKAKGIIYVVVESIYSMDGDEAPLKEIVEICEEYGANLIVDEAHAVGIFGEKGEGLVVQHQLQNDVFARVVTFGKSLGCHGAIVLGNQLLRDYLINYARSFIYTTALPLQNILTIRQAYRFLENNKERQEILHQLIDYFNQLSSQHQLPVIKSGSSIQSLIFKGNDEVKQVANQLQQKGFDVHPILSPTVPKGSERLRICLHSFNTKKQIDDTVEIIVAYLNLSLKRDKEGGLK